MKNTILSLIALGFAGFLYAGSSCCPVAGGTKEAKKQVEAKKACCEAAKAEGKDCGQCKTEKPKACCEAAKAEGKECGKCKAE